MDNRFNEIFHLYHFCPGYDSASWLRASEDEFATHTHPDTPSICQRQSANTDADGSAEHAHRSPYLLSGD